MSEPDKVFEEETENVVPFERRPRLSLSNNFNDSITDWLKDLTIGTIFTSYSSLSNYNYSNYSNSSILNEYIILQHLNDSTRLKDILHDSINWHLNSIFCRYNTLVATIGIIKE